MGKVELIVYACPTGPLAHQLDAYRARVLRELGPNAAHGYMPHVTLTGFYHDDAGSILGYKAAVQQALASAGPHPSRPIRIKGMALTETFHYLKLESPWVVALIQSFAKMATSHTRRESLRLKERLHLSLAYQFPREQHEALAALAREMINPRASVNWELRLYERNKAGWVLHGNWAL